MFKHRHHGEREHHGRNEGHGKDEAVHGAGAPLAAEIAQGGRDAVGGLAYIVPPVQTWNFEVGVAGAGFLALAVMIFGQWKPFNICAAAMFFAVFKSLANIADSTFLAQLHWSSNIYNMMPFIASMIILAFTSKNSMAPKAEGIPYDKGSR